MSIESLNIFRIDKTEHPLINKPYILRKSYVLLMSKILSNINNHSSRVTQFIKLYCDMLNINDEDEYIATNDLKCLHDKQVKVLVSRIKRYYKDSTKFLDMQYTSYKTTFIYDCATSIKYIQPDISYDTLLNSISCYFNLNKKDLQIIQLIHCSNSIKDFQELKKRIWNFKLNKKNTLDFIVKKSTFNYEYIATKPLKVCVMGTMSAGKSTFLNALAGKNILPSRGQACTSKIIQLCHNAFIKHNIGMIQNDNTVEYKGEISNKEIKKLNDLNPVQLLYIETCFDGILSKKPIMFFDTPGVNNSQNLNHKEITYSYIKENNDFDVIVYIMNATQIGTDDEKRCLKELQKTILKSHAKPEIVFILNQVDVFDIDEDGELKDIIKQLEGYLNQNGFNSPNIIPLSSYAAYLFKSVLNKKELSNKQKLDMDALENYYSTESIQLSMQPFVGKYQDNEVNKYVNNTEDFDITKLKELLHYTGLTSIQKYILDKIEN